MRSDPESQRGRMGGRFVVEREVGRGGAGVVYKAWDLLTEQPVALKILAVDAGIAPAEEARLMREGELLAKLDYPGIVKTVAYGMLEDSGLPFLAMEWLDGEDLAQRQRRAPLDMRQAVLLAIRVAEALGFAHDAGVIHRDIKPGNIFLCRSRVEPREGELDVFPKLVDFGVAATGDIRITRNGDVVGTPAYMAPEQARGDAPIDVRSDVYALGATLFELVAGRPPHVGPTAIATLARLVTTEPPRLRDLRRDVPPKLDELVHEMLATDPDARPESAREVVELLEESLRDAARVSWADLAGVEPAMSSRLGSSATRLITSIVAIRFAKGSARERALQNLRERGADAVPLGQDAIVAHLGARRAVGTEATTALDLGRRLARAGARVGIASGRARLSLASDTGEVQPVGEVVDRASALARDAGAGVVLADATTSELGRGRYEFRARDDGSAVVGEQMRGARGERGGGAPFVGREPELAQVLSAFERSRLDSTPILVTVTGPPGIGKTRLRREVLARISAQAEAPPVVLQRSEAYARGHALGAAADVLRAIIGLPKGYTAEETASAIVARLGPTTRDELTAQNRVLLARLLANEPLPEGLDPRGSRDALWLAMTDMVLQVVADEPTVIIMEDLQWGDPESIGWIDHLLGRASHRPLVVMAMVRPLFWIDNPSRFAGRDHVRLELRPVSRRASRAIARSLLGEEAPDELVDRIVEQAAGLPLFAEELARLTAHGRDTEHAPTIEAVIQVSLDALDDECRDAIGRLSVLGLSVWDSALEALGLAHAESVMKALSQAEVVMEQNSSRFSGTREWLFKHALVREVAYSSLGDRERTELHALAAGWLSSMGEDAATVARHYDLGGRFDAAAEYWTRAAQRALATNALGDALTMADRALAFAEDKPTGFVRACYLDEAWSRLDPRASERETAIRALEENVHDEASAVRARGSRARYDDARGTGEGIDERLAEVRDEAAALGLRDEEARCSAALAARLAFAGSFAEAEQEAARLLALTSEHGIKAAAVDGWWALAIIRQSRGALSSALDARRSAVTAARSAGLKEREAMLTTNLGFALTTIGARQESRGTLETGLALADAIGSQGAVRHAQMNLLGWAATFGNDRQLEGQLAEVRADADATAAGVWAAPDRSNLGLLFYRGWELLRAKNDANLRRACSLLKMSADGYRAAGHRDVLPVALAVWAEAERRTGDADRAAALACEAAGLLEGGAPSLLNESTVYLALHDACLEVGDLDGARSAVSRGLPPLIRRIHGLVGTAYARLFLTEFPPNAGLLAAAEGFGLVPDEVHRVLEREHA
ncbi:MAG: protein kinase [Sorangiineae bacterium]|nr:protein kinase [Polyangiaceae bacterium]MEB2321068.1 protein kinase [Sorangiineae bacterium]